MSVITEGHKLPLLTIPESCILANNKSAIDNACFVTKALEDLIAANCISIVQVAILVRSLPPRMP